MSSRPRLWPCHGIYIAAGRQEYLRSNAWAGGDNLAEGEFTVHVSGLTATVNGETVVEGGVLVE